ncbi:type IV toxin-antitoxin system AbiEi family antitoxin domain-containing protein [Gordonia phthalatica]|uniref:AbiEi antitoxin N-terminal domain-containing protein n=1 Tax=Gordonia phthalatica TaxID=1136941 RepID=A0A0N9NA96_9ACTN|nr:type IV toxin-antitoxin system AbiEi family antitoxin domain-containing protein [Gordonia phthalatica]ALG85252.1 hypothetical protein ACH46_13165 [Gordonia phthalatica]
MGTTGDARNQALEQLAELLRKQDGVVARRQVIDCGLDASFMRNRVRSGRWVPVHKGVCVTHTGELTRRQREWAAVLAVAPAALSHESAIVAAGGAGFGLETRPIQVVVPADRNLVRPSGIGLHYSRFFDDRVMANARPPRVRLEHAVLDVAGEAVSDFDAVALLAGVVQARLTTPERLLDALAARSRTGRRAFLESVLVDVRDGACSVLEHRYLTEVERAHGLPRGARQTETGVGRRGFRDVEYAEWRLIVELDGRLNHDSATARDADMERDLDAAVFASKRSLRLGWGQAERACRTAGKVARVLNNLGWTGSASACGPTCSIGLRR